MKADYEQTMCQLVHTSRDVYETDKLFPYSMRVRARTNTHAHIFTVDMRTYEHVCISLLHITLVLTGGDVRVLTASLRCFKFKGCCCWCCCCSVCGGTLALGEAPELNGQNISPDLSIKSASKENVHVISHTLHEYYNRSNRYLRITFVAG